MRSFYKVAISFSLVLLGACASGGNESTLPQTENQAPAPSNQQGQPGQVINKLEQAGDVTYKIYLQPEANAGNRKGLILLGSGNNETDPSTGSLDGALENSTALELAKLGYVSAIVAYRDQPYVGQNFENWDSNSQMLATDMSNVADAIIKTHGPGLSRDRVLTAGSSYTSFSLLTNISLPATPLADTRGFLAACGSTQEYAAQNFKLPVFTLNCSGNPEGDLNGQALMDKITNPAILADSGFFTDNACNTHCGGDINTWTSKLVERTQLWLP